MRWHALTLPADLDITNPPHRTQQNESPDPPTCKFSGEMGPPASTGSCSSAGAGGEGLHSDLWTMSRGLEYQDSALKDIFNLCLDNPLPQWNSWGFWNFSNYVHHCKVWQILLPPESTCTDQPTVPISDRPILIFLNRYRDRLFACYCTR